MPKKNTKSVYSPKFQILNERDKIYTDKLPAKILSGEAIDGKIAAAGYASTDYVDSKIADALPLKITVHTDEVSGYEEVDVETGTTEQIIDATNAGRIVWVVLPERGESYTNLYAVILTDTNIQFKACGQSDYIELNSDTLYIFSNN